MVSFNAVGLGIGLILDHAPIMRDAGKLGYANAQRELAASRLYNPDVLLLDLSLLIEPRSAVGSEPQPGTDDDFALSKQYAGLSDLLPQIVRAKPKALLLDWDVTLPTAFRDPKDRQLGLTKKASDELRVSYGDLMQALKEASQKLPVIVMADGSEQLRAKREQVFPVALAEHHLASGRLYQGDLEPYVPFAPASALRLSTLPSFSDALLANLDLEDRLEQPRKGIFFSAKREVDGAKVFWINYGSAPQLLEKAISVEPIKLKQNPQILSGLKEKIVLLADVSAPIGEDAIDLPLPSETRHLGGEKGLKLRSGSGGLAHACAILTRIKKPIYALDEGWSGNLLLFILSILVGLATMGISDATCKIRKRESHAWEAGIELLVFALVTLTVLLWVPAWLARASLFVPQTPAFLMARFTDLIGVIWSLFSHGSGREGALDKNPGAGQPAADAQSLKLDA